MSVGTFTVSLSGSKHVHASLPALLEFYQDPKYFAQNIELDVPVQLVAPGAPTPAAPPAASDGEDEDDYSKAADVGELYEAMWWRKDGPAAGASASTASVPHKGGNYATIYHAVHGGTLKQKKLYERIVTASGYEACLRTYNPLDQLEQTPDVSFTDAIAAVNIHCEGDMVAEGKVALGYAAKHAHVGTVQRTGAGAKPLTADDIAAVHMYTMETSFYSRLNQELGGYGAGIGHAAINDFLPITKLLIAALAKLPTIDAKLFRGVKMDYKAILGSDVKTKDVKQWNQVTSCSTRPDVLKDADFLGVGNPGTVFQIIAVIGVNVKPYSAIEGEDEVVLPPGSRFVIDKITPCKDGVTEVRMRTLVEDGASSQLYENLGFLKAAPPPFLQKKLCAEIVAGNVSNVSRLLGFAGACPSTPGPAQPTWPPVYLAAHEGQHDCVQVLLEYNADPSQAETGSGQTPLEVATQKGKADVKYFCRAYAEVQGVLRRALQKESAILMHIAAQKGHTEVLKLLLEKDADGMLPINEVEYNGSTPLHVAAANGHEDVVKLLLENKADPKLSDHQNGRTPLCIAAHQGRVECLKALLAGKADPNQADRCGRTPLLTAEQNGRKECVKVLRWDLDLFDPSDTVKHGQLVPNQVETTHGTTTLEAAIQLSHTYEEIGLPTVQKE